MTLVLLKGCTGTNKQIGNHDDAGTVERQHRDKQTNKQRGNDDAGTVERLHRDK